MRGTRSAKAAGVGGRMARAARHGDRHRAQKAASSRAGLEQGSVGAGRGWSRAGLKQGGVIAGQEVEQGRGVEQGSGWSRAGLEQGGVGAGQGWSRTGFANRKRLLDLYMSFKTGNPMAKRKVEGGRGGDGHICLSLGMSLKAGGSRSLT
eukprot:scaffold2101_cov98-Isochrysis_galbana.AAC.6